MSIKATACAVAAIVVLASAATAAGATRNGATPLGSPANGAPPVGHVWLIMLENHSYPENFGAPAKRFSPTAPCTHPPLGAFDQGDASSEAGYETGNNPFLYFSNWIEDPSFCNAQDVPLNRNTFEPLLGDLSSIATTPT